MKWDKETKRFIPVKDLRDVNAPVYKHGTASKYLLNWCRCEACCSAYNTYHTTYMREYRKRKRDEKESR